MEKYTTLQMASLFFLAWVLWSFFISIGVFIFYTKKSSDLTFAMVFFFPVWFSIYLVVAIVATLYRVITNSIDLIIEP